MMINLKYKQQQSILKQTGQVVVEYVLLLVVIITLVLAAFKIIKTYVSFDPTKCGQGSFNPVCVLKNLTPEGEGESQKFRFFSIKR